MFHLHIPQTGIKVFNSFNLKIDKGKTLGISWKSRFWKDYIIRSYM